MVVTQMLKGKEMDSIRVGKTIAFFRKRNRYTQMQLAQMLGISDKAVSKWERGLGLPDVSLLRKLGEVFDVDIESILDGDYGSYNKHWVGILELNDYGDITPFSMIYNKPLVYLQMVYFLLAGIRKVYIVGNEDYLIQAKKLFSDGTNWGISIEYLFSIEEFSICTNKDINGIMFQKSFVFIYGKDFTRVMRRIMTDSHYPVVFANARKSMDSICFFPENTFGKHMPVKKWGLERGMISFEINNSNDLLDASILTKIVSRHQGGLINELSEIARVRGYI